MPNVFTQTGDLSAVYLCGYVLECFLKFVICKVRKQKSAIGYRHD